MSRIPELRIIYGDLRLVAYSNTEWAIEKKTKDKLGGDSWITLFDSCIRGEYSGREKQWLLRAEEFQALSDLLIKGVRP